MPIPWLKNKKERQSGGMSVEYRKPDEGKEGESDEHGLEACAQDLIQAIDMKDKKQVLAALRSIFEILDSMPHEEGEHTNEDEDKE